MEIEFGKPANVAIEDVVIDDEDVAKRVELCTVTVHNSWSTLWKPLVNLSQPVCFHHVGHHDKQGKSTGHLSGDQCLRRLAQTRLVGQEETSVSRANGFDKL